MQRPAYLHMGLEALERRACQAVAGLSDCRYCPRDCGVDRLADRWSACKTGRYAVVSSYFAHRGEEDCLRGQNGSGTIFFAHCNLRCVFCQNWEISQGMPPPGGSRTQDGTGHPRGTRPERLAEMMLELQDRGCHNVNLVTPEHVVPQVLEALAIAVAGGLSLPIVYNTSGYDCLASLRLLDGVVDIYMPDFKLWTRDASRRYLKAADYPDAARAALREMHRQVGDLQLDANGLAVHGVLVRHLVMPGLLDETRAILEWIARDLDANTYVNLMDQYYPAGSVADGRFAELRRGLKKHEYEEALRAAHKAGLSRLDGRAPTQHSVV
jgi:putative pyruvate formate lyase activating enzyme